MGVWDSSNAKHGEQVANLILGPFESSLIPSAQPQAYIDLESTEDYFAAYEKAADACKEPLKCPRFINNSMVWKDSFLIKEVVQKLQSDQGVVFVTAAGNDYIELEAPKREAARDGYSIVVASHAPNGLSSEFTNYAPEVDISAPSNNEILSFYHNGSSAKFGGTSGATPLVTSTLLAFELIAGIELTTPQFKTLLKRSAIRYRDDSHRKLTGEGYLNSFKLGAIAFKLVELCNDFREKTKRDECILNSLDKEDLYDFSNEVNADRIITNISSAFPDCGEAPDLKAESVSCVDQKSALKNLRKAAFLVPENFKFWEKLACVHRVMGLSINAQYYSRLARGKKIIEEDLKVDSLSTADISELFSNHDASTQSLSLILEVVKQSAGALDYASDELINDREFILQAVKKNGHALFFVSDALKKDREVVLEAVKQTGEALEYASKELQNDPEIKAMAKKIR